MLSLFVQQYPPDAAEQAGTQSGGLRPLLLAQDFCSSVKQLNFLMKPNARAVVTITPSGWKMDSRGSKSRRFYNSQRLTLPRSETASPLVRTPYR